MAITLSRLRMGSLRGQRRTEEPSQEIKGMANKSVIEIQPANSVPVLNWYGKRPLDRLIVFPAKKIGVFGKAPEDAVPYRFVAYFTSTG